MRNGRILVEECPSKLLEKYNYCRLEQVVLHICKLDNDQICNKLRSGSHREDDNNSLKFLPSWNFSERTNTQYDINMQPKDSLRKLQDSLHENEHSDIYNFFRTTFAFANVIFLIFLRFPAYVQVLNFKCICSLFFIYWKCNLIHFFLTDFFF